MMYSPVLKAIYDYLNTKKASYARPINSGEISRHLNLNPSYVREQMKGLVESRVIGVRRGPKGGYFVLDTSRQLRITVNGQENTYASGTFAEVYHNLLQRLQAERKVVVRLKVNEIELRDIKDYSGDLEEISKVSINTRQVDDLLGESIDTAKDYLPALYKGILTTSEQIQSGQEGEAMKVLQQVIEGLEWFSVYVQAITHYVADNEELIDPDANFAKLMEIFKDLCEAMEAQDFIWISDITAYELATLVERWVTITERVSAVA